MSASNSLSGNQDQTQTLNQNIGAPEYFINDDFLEAFDGTDFNSNLGWIFTPSPYNDFYKESEPLDIFNLVNMSNNFSFPTMLPQAALLPTRPSDNEESLLDENSMMTGLPIPHPQEGCSADDPWPMEWHARVETYVNHIVIPSLGNDTPDPGLKYFSTTPMSAEARSTLQEYVQIPSKGSPWRPVIMERFPSREKLDHCIDMYFVHFHPVSTCS